MVDNSNIIDVYIVREVIKMTSSYNYSSYSDNLMNKKELSLSIKDIPHAFRTMEGIFRET